MSARLVTPQRKLDEFFQKAMKIMYDEILKALSYLGEECVVRIKDRSPEESWIDRTGNLRSSIGYAVYNKGRKEIQSVFEPFKNGKDGSSKGKEMVDQLASQYSTTFALVCVAAMEYAEFVEAIDSKDVLASTEEYAKSKVNEYLEKALHKAENLIKIMQASL